MIADIDDQAGERVRPGVRPRLTREDLLRVSLEIEREGIGLHPPAFSELVLLEIDPRRLHAYWSVTPADLMDTRRLHQLPNAPLTLWLFAVDDVDQPAQQVVATGFSGRHDFTALVGGRAYRAVIGLPLADGMPAVVAVSNPVLLPPPEPSVRTEFQAMDVRHPAVARPAPSPSAAPTPVRPDAPPAGRPARPGVVAEPGGAPWPAAPPVTSSRFAVPPREDAR